MTDASLDQIIKQAEKLMLDRQKTDRQRAMEKQMNRQMEAYRTELCRLYRTTGTCRYGAQCRFAHSQEELRERPIPRNYKTRLCHNFEQTGFCMYGAKCQFIHRGVDRLGLAFPAIEQFIPHFHQPPQAPLISPPALFPFSSAFQFPPAPQPLVPNSPLFHFSYPHVPHHNQFVFGPDIQQFAAANYCFGRYVGGGGGTGGSGGSGSSSSESQNPLMYSASNSEQSTSGSWSN